MHGNGMMTGIELWISGTDLETLLAENKKTIAYNLFFVDKLTQDRHLLLKLFAQQMKG